MIRWSQIGPAFCLAILITMPLLAAWSVPHAGRCVVKGMIGISCPGCGLGHALLAARAGNWIEAFEHYPPLLPLSLLYLAGLWAVMGRLAGRRPSRLLARSAEYLGGGTAAALVMHWAIVVAAR